MNVTSLTTFAVLGTGLAMTSANAAVTLVSHDFTNASRTSNPTGGTPASGATGVTGLDAHVAVGGGITDAWNGTTNDYVVATNGNLAMAGSQGGPAFFDAINVAAADNASPTPNTAINGNSLRIMNLGSAYSLSTYFPAVTLGNGESISASFKFKVTKIATPGAGTGALRIGLFNSGADKLTANSGSFSQSVFTDDAGYIAGYSTGTSLTPVGINQRRNGGGTGNIFQGSLATLTGPTIDNGGQMQGNTTYEVTLTLARSADGLSQTLTSTFGDGAGAYDDASMVASDPNSPHATFDHLSILVGGVFGGAAGPANFIDDVNVTYVPEPAAAALFAPVALLGVRRRRA
jgi:hypothetical protein